MKRGRRICVRDDRGDGQPVMRRAASRISSTVAPVSLPRLTVRLRSFFEM